ncbi:hypothetical protein P171DRAFT_341148, partial [Karstenula rhodostoma CBS 690.94]
RSDAFIEGHSNKVDIYDFEPGTFEMFVEFMYFGRYTYKDDLTDHLRLRDSAKAWILGDYFDAVEFKNFAIRNLHDVYMSPGSGGRPKTGIGPKMVDYCYSQTASGSPLSQLVLAFLVQNWHDSDIIHYDGGGSWELVWAQHPTLRDELL